MYITFESMIYLRRIKMILGSLAISRGGLHRVDTSFDIRAQCVVMRYFSSSRAACRPAHPSALLAAPVVTVSANDAGFPRNSDSATAASGLLHASTAHSHQHWRWLSRQTGSTRALCEGQDGSEAVDSTSEGEITESQQHRWRGRFEALVKFKEAHGHCNVPQHYEEKPQLGRWVDKQRWAKCKGKLAPERERQLDELGFVWSKSSDERWEEMFRQLEEFQTEHGHCNVPSRYEKNPKLGTWVKKQRQAKAEQKLVPERERWLEDLGFVWSKSSDERWEEMFRQLEEFHMEYGHCNVPRHYEENPQLGWWVNNQRQAKADGKLAPERERRLEDVGFVWSLQDEAWEEMFWQLEEFGWSTALQRAFAVRGEPQAGNVGEEATASKT